MKNLTTIFVMLLCINTLLGQSQNESAVILISASSTPKYIGEMKDHLANIGIIFNVEKEIWKDQETLQEFAFTIKDPNSKSVKSFSFKYNDLNRHQMFMVYPASENYYAEVMTDVSYLRSELLSLLIPLKIKRLKPILHRSYGKSGAPYRESIVLTDLKKLEDRMNESLSLFKKIRADQTVGKCLSGLTYTYNGQLLDDPSGINLNDMTSDVLIETLEDESQIINIWSEEPLNEIVMGATIVGQR